MDGSNWLNFVMQKNVILEINQPKLSVLQEVWSIYSSKKLSLFNVQYYGAVTGYSSAQLTEHGNNY